MEAQEIFIVFYQQLLARTVDMPLGVGRVVWSFKKKESEESSTAWTVEDKVKKILKGIAQICSYHLHLHWKFKLWTRKFAWGV